MGEDTFATSSLLPHSTSTITSHKLNSSLELAPVICSTLEEVLASPSIAQPGEKVNKPYEMKIAAFPITSSIYRKWIAWPIAFRIIEECLWNTILLPTIFLHFYCQLYFYCFTSDCIKGITSDFYYSSAVDFNITSRYLQKKHDFFVKVLKGMKVTH